jgi:hypothetical protein
MACRLLGSLFSSLPTKGIIADQSQEFANARLDHIAPLFSALGAIKTSNYDEVRLELKWACDFTPSRHCPLCRD